MSDTIDFARLNRNQEASGKEQIEFRPSSLYQYFGAETPPPAKEQVLVAPPAEQLHLNRSRVADRPDSSTTLALEAVALFPLLQREDKKVDAKPVADEVKPAAPARDRVEPPPPPPFVNPELLVKGLHTRDEIVKSLPPGDHSKFEILCLERSILSNPDEIARKEAQIRSFLTERFGTCISDRGYKAAFEPLKMPDALLDACAKAGGECKGLVDRVQQHVIDRAFERIKDPGKLAELVGNMTAFRWRAKQVGLPDHCVAETLLQVGRVLDPSAKLQHGDPGIVARGIMRNAAEPTSIDQGGHNTCNVTTLECRLYTREPQTAARLVADIAVTGQFKTADGTVVKPRTLKPDSEAQADPTPDGWRNYASQIFQITAINVHWNRQDTLPGGKEAGVGNIQYCQGGPGEPGEYLLNCSKEPPEIHRFSTIDSDHPWLDLDAISQVNEQITGKPSTNFGIERWFVSGENRGCYRVSSLAELKERLAAMAAEKAFPVILVVDAAKKPIGSGGGGFGPHVVTITSYDPQTEMLTIDNQWGKGADMTGQPGQRSMVSAAEMFDNMSQVPSTDFIWDHIKKSVKDLAPSDAISPGIAALSVRGLRYGTFGGAPTMLRSGLESLSRHGVPGSTAVLAASETRFGRIGMRTGTALGAIGLAFVANDLRSAFREGTVHGLSKTARIGVDSLSFELGAVTASGVARLTGLSRWAPGRTGLVLGTGLLAATLVDRIAGESVEIGTSYLYEKARDRLRTWWKK